MENRGRFEGTEFTGVGRIRANHPGVICISTSKEGKLGGFQIIPARHAQVLSEVYGPLDQWMVVGPDLEGSEPLFRGHLRPSYEGEDLFRPGWAWRLMSRARVEVMERGKPLPSWARRCLREVEVIRILLPQLMLAPAPGKGR